jgi:frataxin-like iron-binding protein CyaY
MSETENKIVVFFDQVGRTILGERVESETNDNVLTIKNPAVVHIMPNQQTGQLQLQILPLFFKEFLADKDSGTIWKYNRKNITEAVDVTFDFKLEAQYKQIFSNIILPSAPQQPQGAPEVVKLFDE